ncbi:MAG TPA: TolC family protein [Candidatus Dependentiae bacterium]|nr:TolC family protein [Candidatus Dependentiae bacterium]
MNMKFVSLIGLILLLPQCGRQNIKKTFQPVQEESKRRINVEPRWTKAPARLQVAAALDKGITLQDAIMLGINHNPTLQAQFEEIGISQSDLIQAGFYSNPNLSTIFNIPKKDTVQTDISVVANFVLSDLWQVPLRKKMSQDSLEIKTYEIIDEVLQLRRTIQQQYLTCLYNSEYLQLVKEITAVIKNIKERIDYRYQFGYNSDLDKYFASTKVAEWQAKIIEAETELRKSYLALHELLGSYILPTTIKLLDSIHLSYRAISQENLESFALSSHPLILVGQARIDRAQHTISYEKSRIVDDVTLGIAYGRDFEKGVAGVGPSFGINIPLFNTNYGNIERAKFEYKLAEKELFAQEQMILRNIITHYIAYKSYLKQIELYNKNIIPSVGQAIEFSKKFFDRMQMNMIVFLETQIDLFQNKIMLLDLKRKAAFEYSELELAVGAQIDNIDFSRRVT